MKQMRRKYPNVETKDKRKPTELYNEEYGKVQKF
jgi:hypothetical protein